MNADWKSPNAIIALAFIVFAFFVFGFVLFQRLGGDNAVFAILGYIAGWVSSIVLFFYRKSPPKGEK
jgi:amino acid transporter